MSSFFKRSKEYASLEGVNGNTPVFGSTSDGASTEKTRLLTRQPSPAKNASTQSTVGASKYNGSQYTGTLGYSCAAGFKNPKPPKTSKSKKAGQRSQPQQNNHKQQEGQAPHAYVNPGYAKSNS